ncbi:hypothetical protein AB2N08_16415 [Massilia aurea]|uniref:post-PEP-CTERM-1 domain-containing protein n=1 Tax=Massilia aurea TaxID=373040 RepID=UPI003462EEAB
MRATAPLSFLALALLFGAAGATPPTPAAQGLTVVRDAETGQLRAPTPGELQNLRRQSSSTPRPAPITEVVGPGGERTVELGERGLVYAVVRRSADGTATQHCVDSAHAATQAIEQAVARAGASHDDHR